MSELALKPFLFFEGVRRQAASAACGSPFYNWLLSSGSLPNYLVVKLVDPWPGQTEIGRSMCRGVLSYAGATLSYDQNLWEDVRGVAHWHDYAHGFSWLRDLRALGGDAPRKLARYLVDSWIDSHDRWEPDIWRADLIGERLSMWLVLFDFFCGSADEDFQQKYFSSLVRQARHLSRNLPGALTGIPLLRAAKGLVYAGLSLPGRDAWVLQGFQIILPEIPKQLLEDGSHISRSPEQLAEFCQILLDLRYALNRSNLPVPGVMKEAILRSGNALRFFRYADKKLALFHGGQEGNIIRLDAVQSQIPVPGKPPRSLSQAGFERVSLGRSLLLFDCGMFLSSSSDQTGHASPLSFEFAFGKERVFTNCGGHPTVPEWKQVLRHTAAHNGLTIDGRSVCDFDSNGFLERGKGASVCSRTETRDSCLLDASWQIPCGITHRRRLYLSDQGHDLRGEETLTVKSEEEISEEAPRAVAVRFHLHPRVLLSLNKEGQEIFLRLPGGTGWKFYAVGGTISLENSVYLGSGAKPQKTWQIVIRSDLKAKDLQIKWALQRE